MRFLLFLFVFSLVAAAVPAQVPERHSTIVEVHELRATGQTAVFGALQGVHPAWTTTRPVVRVDGTVVPHVAALQLLGLDAVLSVRFVYDTPTGRLLALHIQTNPCVLPQPRSAPARCYMRVLS